VRDAVYIIGIVIGVVLAFKVGEAEGMKSIPTPAPVAVNLENQCVAWFFNADLKAAKKHMCGSKR